LDPEDRVVLAGVGGARQVLRRRGGPDRDLATPDLIERRVDEIADPWSVEVRD